MHIVTHRQANARMIVRVPYPEVLREAGNAIPSSSPNLHSGLANLIQCAWLALVLRGLFSVFRPAT